MFSCPMSSLFIAIGSWILVVLLIEWFLWMLFSHKFAQIYMSAQGDKIFFHFFTLGRLRILALVHTLIMILLVVVGHLLLWP